MSIGLPVRNGSPYLTTAIADLLDQSFTDFELLISDNASQDDTEEICRAAARDPRVRYVRHESNIGAAANYNFVFSETSGTYFRWASHDDGCAPNHLEACMDRFSAATADVVLVYPKTLIIDEAGFPIRVHDDNLQMDQSSARDRLVVLARNWGLCNPVMGLMRRDAASNTRLIDTFRTSDLVFLAELALQGRVLEVPQPLFFRRIHGGSAMQGGATDAATWLDPAARNRKAWTERWTLPVLREILRSVHRHPVSRRERASIELAVGSAWVARRVRVNGGRARRLIRPFSPAASA